LLSDFGPCPIWRALGLNFKMHETKKNEQGFTLIEIMMSIVIIGILSGIVVSIINPKRQQDIATDAVNKTYVEKLVQAIGAACAGEGTCPATADPGVSTSTLRRIYLSQTPPSFNTGTGIYYIASGNTYSIYMAWASNTARYWKYDTTWDSIKECGAAGIGTIGTCAP